LLALGKTGRETDLEKKQCSILEKLGFSVWNFINGIITGNTSNLGYE
jgi:hypothetical protein